MTEHSQTLFECKNLHFRYRGEWSEHMVLNGITTSVHKGDFVCLTGPSGSGKSTLLNLLGLIEAPQEGQLLFDHQDVKTFSESKLNQIRRFQVGFIFQDFQLIDVLSVEENVEFFLTRQQVPAAERSLRVEQALVDVGLWEHRKKRPGQLSGGQKQRVAIARALAKQPLVIVADEPTASLDHKTGMLIMEHLCRVNQNRAVTLVLASHDPMVIGFGGRELRMQDGVILTDSKR